MRQLIVFNNQTLDGYFSGTNGDIGWSHRPQNDPEWKKFTADNAKGDGTLLFGRITYELMASYWPTPAALQNDPAVAERINNLKKVVFSRTLDKAAWNNTELVKTDMVDYVRRMKQGSGDPMVIMGSGSLVSQLTQEHLIDEYQVIVNPVVLGKGRTMFDGIKDMLRLKLEKTRTFGNGNVLQCYQPAA
jgi:dihydrofolate reductase